MVITIWLASLCRKRLGVDKDPHQELLVVPIV